MAAARRAVAAVLRSAAARSGSAMLHPAPSSAVVHSPSSATAGSADIITAPSYAAAGSAAIIPAPSYAAAGSGASSFVAGSGASSVVAGSGAFHRAPSSMAAGPAGFHHAASSVAAGSGAFHRASPSTLARWATSPAAGHRSTARLGFLAARLTKATAPTGMRYIHLLVARPMEPHLQIELARLDARVFSRQREIADAINDLGERLTVEEAENLLYLTQQVIHIGQVSWRVCTTVITVAVAAGVGVLQLAKGDWELESQQEACSLVTCRLAQTRMELEDYMAKQISHKRSVAAAKAFLANQKMMAKESELAEREASLVKREEDLVARETAAAAVAN